MTFKQAKAKLKGLAKGEYHSISYELEEYSDNSRGQRCGLYIHGGKWCIEDSWEEAFKELEASFEPEAKPKPIKTPDIAEIKKGKTD